MGQLIPAIEIETADIKALTRAVETQLIDVAARILNIPKEEVIIRDALPATDFGLAYEYWSNPALSANAYTEYFSQKLVDKAAAFYGITNLAADPKATGARFYVGPGRTKLVDIVQFEDIYTLAENVSGYFKEPIIFSVDQTVTCDLYAKAAVAAGAEPVVWKVLIAERAGEVTF